MIREIIKMKLRRILLSVVLFYLSSATATAQVMEVGANVGASGYMGDLNPKDPFDFSGAAFGVFVKGNLDPYWAVGIHYNHGRVKDNDATSSNPDFRSRNLNFSTPLNELSLQVDFNFFDYFSGGGTKNFSPFIFAGIGGVLFNPKATYQDQEYELRYYQTEGKRYRNYALSVPFGAGIKYRISDHWGLQTQLGYRTAHTDYLDDVGDRYPLADVYGRIDNQHPLPINLSNPSQLPQNWNPGGQRGDFRKNDTYFFFHIGISYTFISDKCFTF